MYKNKEGYNDSTAGTAIHRADKQPEEVDWMVKMFREVAEKLGYEIVNRIAFRDRHTGRKWE